MGNENSKNKELTRNGTVTGKQVNGSVKGPSANTPITSNGLEVAVNGETTVQQNGEPLSLNLATDSTEYIVVESECKPAEAPVISEIPKTIVQKEEVKESDGDQTDDSDSSGDEVSIMIITEHHRDDFEYPQQQAEISTQTERRTEAAISTQTVDVDTSNYIDGPVEEIVIMETVATEEAQLNIVIAEEVFEDMENMESLDNQTAGVIIEEVVMENNVYESTVFRAEPVEVTDIIYYNPEEESMNWHEESEPEIAEEPESGPNQSVPEDETVTEGNLFEETVPLEFSFSLPKVVAECVEAVFNTSFESTDFAAIDTSEPSTDEVIIEEDGEGPGDMSADGVLIETAEPESNIATPGAGEANGIPSPDEEPVTTMMETISEVVPIPANQDFPVEELSVPSATALLVKVESAHEDINADDGVAVEDVPGIFEQGPLDDEPSEECDRCSEEVNIVRAPSNELFTIEELPDYLLSSPDDENKPESIPEDIHTDNNAEVDEDVRTDVGPHQVGNPVIVKDSAEWIMEAAIDALSQQFEFCAITPEEPHCILLEEESIVATIFLPLSGEQESSLAIPEEPVVEEMNIEATEASSNEIEAVPETVEEDATGGEVTWFASSEEPVDDNDYPSSSEEDTTSVVLEDILKTESTVEEHLDVPPNKAMEESEPCIRAQKELVEANVAPDSNHVISQDMRGEERASHFQLFISVEPVARELTKEATDALSNEMEAVPESVKEDCSGGEVDGVASSEEPVDDNENPSSCEEDATNELLESIQESEVDTTSEEHEVTVEEREDVPITNSTEESYLCISIEPVVGEMTEEAIEALSDQIEAVPERVEEDSTGEVNRVSSSEEPVHENDNPSSCEEDATTEVLENIQESVVEAVSEETEVTESTLEELVDVPWMNTKEDSEPCISVQEELVECNVALDSSHISEELVEESSSRIEQQPKNNMLVINFKTIEDKLTEEIMLETYDSGAFLAEFEENSEDAMSDEPESECVNSVLETIVEEIITEDVVATECYLVTPEEVESEVITEGETEEKAENETSTNSIVSTPDSQSVPSTDMEALVLRLQSACVSVVEESVYRLGGLELSSLGYSITVTIHVAPRAEEQ